MSYLKMLLMTLISLSFLLVSIRGGAKEAVRLNYKEPMEMKEMKDYENIRFKIKNFEKIKRGMTETEVLNLLGKPLNLKKVKRKKNRWTAQYTYPDSHVVNLKNGLVVGKERR